MSAPKPCDPKDCYAFAAADGTIWINTLRRGWLKLDDVIDKIDRALELLDR